MAAGVAVAMQAPGQPQHLGGAQGVPQLLLHLSLAQARVAVGVEQALLRGQQRAAGTMAGGGILAVLVTRDGSVVSSVLQGPYVAVGRLVCC